MTDEESDADALLNAPAWWDDPWTWTDHLDALADDEVRYQREQDRRFDDRQRWSSKP